MKKIGQGWQYITYDIGNGRVLKKKYSVFSQFFFIRSRQISKGNPYSFVQIIASICRVNIKAAGAIKYFRKNSEKIDLSLLANPVFLDGINYEQDKIKPLKEVFKTCSTDEGKKIFDKYTELIKTTWKYGFADNIFNFLENNGVDKNGQLVQPDFGELYFRKEEISRQIKNKKWLQTTCFRTFPEGELKKYFEMIMNKEITLENLDKLFKKI